MNNEHNDPPNTQHKKLFRVSDIITLVVLIAAVGIIFLLNNSRQTGLYAIVSKAGELEGTQKISLKNNEVYNLVGNNKIAVTLKVQDGEISFVNVKCPDRRCEGFGKLSKEGQYAICMPAGVNVEIQKRN